MSPELLGLVPHLMPMLSHGTDDMPILLKILQSYCRLDGHTIISTHAGPIMDAFATVLGGLSPEKVKVVLHAFNTTIASASAETWGSALDASGCFEKLVSPLSVSEHFRCYCDSASDPCSYSRRTSRRSSYQSTSAPYPVWYWRAKILSSSSSSRQRNAPLLLGSSFSH